MNNLNKNDWNSNNKLMRHLKLIIIIQNWNNKYRSIKIKKRKNLVEIKKIFFIFK